MIVLLSNQIFPVYAERFVPGYGSSLSPKRRMFSVVGSDRDRFVFTPEANRTRVRLEADRDHLKKWVSVRLFGPDQGSLVRIHTCTKGPDQGGKRTLVRLKRTKRGRCEYTLRDLISSVCWMRRSITLLEAEKLGK